MSGPQPGTDSVALPPLTTVRAGSPPSVAAITGTSHASGTLPGRSLVNSPCDSCTVVLPPSHAAPSTRMSGTPGCVVN